MKVENNFAVDAPIAPTWEALTDLARIASCLPGTEITDDHDGVFSGSIKFKVGPVTAEYRANATLVERDVANRRAVIDCVGQDSRGDGNARAVITAQLEDLGDTTTVNLQTELQVTGRVSHFGRGVVQEASDNLAEHFSHCISKTVHSAHQPALGFSAVNGDRSFIPADAAVTNGDGLDLVTVAGPALVKRIVPVAALVVAIVVLLLILL